MNLEPLPVEKEFRLALVKKSLSELSREQLEDGFTEAIDKLVRMTHQTKQLLNMIQDLTNETLEKTNTGC
jgi:hypothetical protein